MRIGIDLGGTKIEGIVIDERQRIQHRLRIATPQSQGYQAIVNAITTLVTELESAVNKPCTVGIGTPGSIDQRSGLLKYSNTVCLNDQPLKQDLESALNREVKIANDANCFALSEAFNGAGINHRCVFGVIMGTGVGGGISIDHQLLNGPNSMTGEWGHIVLHPNGGRCYCGQNGCIETYLSGPGVLNQYQSQSGHTLASVQALLHLADSNDAQAKRVIEDFHDNFALAMSMVIKMIDPDIIVLGGGLSNIQSLYSVAVKKIQQFFSHPISINIVQNVHGDSSGVRGAAYLWK